MFEKPTKKLIIVTDEKNKLCQLAYDAYQCKR